MLAYIQTKEGESGNLSVVFSTKTRINKWVQCLMYVIQAARSTDGQSKCQVLAAMNSITSIFVFSS